MINGFTHGDLNSLPLRCTDCSSMEIRPHQSLPEFGRMSLCSDTRSSSGCCCMTELIQGISSTGNLFIFHLITVNSVTPILKKPLCICFGTVILPLVAGNPSLVIDTEEFLFYEEITLLAQALPTPIAMEILIMGCWNIWIQRNGKIFKSQPYSIQSWRRLLKNCLLILQHRIKNKFEAQLSSWIDQFLS